LLTSFSNQALEARDALSKKLYANLFDWLILSINHSLAGQVDDADASAKSVFIAVLDIFGFEAFEHNRYYITNTTTSTTT
jgi:myosin heavy subunit